MSKVKGFQEEGETWSFPLKPNKESADWEKIPSQENNCFIFSILAQTLHPRQ